MILKMEKIPKEYDIWKKRYCFLPRIIISNRNRFYLLFKEYIWKKDNKHGCSDRISGGLFNFVNIFKVNKERHK